jgi:filamentous hemagglutinin
MEVRPRPLGEASRYCVTGIGPPMPKVPPVGSSPCGRRTNRRDMERLRDVVTTQLILRCRLWQTSPLEGQNRFWGKKLLGELTVGRYRVAKPYRAWASAESTTAGASGCAVLYNRQLHPDERQWAKDKAGKFAQFYKEQTGRDITAEQAQDMLLGNGYRLVDAAASKGPGGDATAVGFISQNGGSLFKATPAEYNSPFLYGNKDGSLTPEQRALPGHEAHPQVGMAAGAAAGLFTLGAVAPTVATAWALGATYDYAGDVISRAMGFSNDGPNVGKSLAVGGVVGATAPFFLPLNTLGNATGGKVAVGVYNALWGGVGAFGATAMTNPGSSADLSAGIGTASSLFGAGVEAKMPGPIGMSINQLLQVLSGPTQAAIEADKQKIPGK